jgi:nickel-dependent lactate racemase
VRLDHAWDKLETVRLLNEVIAYVVADMTNRYDVVVIGGGAADDLWTAAKAMYKTEPAIADGGEVIIYAPHLTEVSYTHGELIDEVVVRVDHGDHLVQTMLRRVFNGKENCQSGKLL